MGIMADRIKLAMDIRNIKQVDLCEITGIGKSSISTYLSGKYEPKQRNLFRIAEALNVNEAWLMGKDDVPMEGEHIAEPTTQPTSNGEFASYREQLRRQPGARMLLDAADDATDQEIEQWVNVINALKKKPYDD